MKHIILAIFLTGALFATDAAAQDDTRKISPLDDRGGMPIPKSLQDLKNLSLSFWIKFRATNQHYYVFVNEAAEFHAYSNLCKRHELSVSMDKITTVAHQFIEATVPSHYDEPELALLEPLSKDDLRAFTADMSSDVYAFEYGYRLAKLMQTIEKSRKTPKAFCRANATRYKDSYIALFMSARRTLNAQS